MYRVIAPWPFRIQSFIHGKIGNVVHDLEITTTINSVRAPARQIQTENYDREEWVSKQTSNDNNNRVEWVSKQTSNSTRG